MGEFINFLQSNLADFWTYTGFYNATYQHFIMIAVGIFFIYLAVAKEFEPMLLIPIGFGMLGGRTFLFNMGGRPASRYLRTGFGSQHLISRSDIGMVSATHLPRHWSHDRLLGIDFQSEADAYRCGSPIRYLWCLYDCT